MTPTIKSEDERDRANFWLQMMVAAALILLLFVCVGCVAAGFLKADSAVVGSAFTMFIVLVNFCFPNSIGSQKAQDTINKLAEKTPPVTGEARDALERERQDASAEPAGVGRDEYQSSPEVTSGGRRIDAIPDLPPSQR